MPIEHPSPLCTTLEMTAIDLAKVRAMRPANPPADAPGRRPERPRVAVLALTAMAGLALGALPFVVAAALI